MLRNHFHNVILESILAFPLHYLFFRPSELLDQDITTGRKNVSPPADRDTLHCIKIDGEIDYIGKSGNMLRRIAQHYAGIQMGTEKKYRIMAEARRKGCNIGFDVLYYAKSRQYADKLAEIGEKEGEYIRKHNPILNTQIPKEENWERWDTKSVDAKSILESIL